MGTSLDPLKYPAAIRAAVAQAIGSGGLTIPCTTPKQAIRARFLIYNYVRALRNSGSILAENFRPFSIRLRGSTLRIVDAREETEDAAKAIADALRTALGDEEYTSALESAKASANAEYLRSQGVEPEQPQQPQGDNFAQGDNFDPTKFSLGGG